MAKEPTIYAVKGNTYVIGDWDVDKALETLVWLTKTFGEGFLALFMSPDKGEIVDKISGTVDGERVNDPEKDAALIKEFASKIVNNVNPKEYVSYTRLIIQGSRCNGEEIKFNTHFRGKMAELHQVMFAILRHQYGDFLEGNAGEE